jgi:TM2 domain-containing membrane protein YozV
MNSVNENPQAAPVRSNFYPTFILALFLGSFGVHRFYTGKIKSGILQLITFGGCGVWWLVDMVLLLLGKFKDKNNQAMPNVNPKLTWPIFVGLIVIGIAGGIAGSGTSGGSPDTGANSSSGAEASGNEHSATGAGGSNSTASSSAPEAIRKKYAGVYETTSGPLTFAGGLGLFASWDYTLMFGQSDKFSGTWTVEGSTIRLKGSSPTDTVLRILNSEQLAYERNGVEVVYTLKERQ